MFIVLDFGSLDLAKSGMRISRPTIAYLAFLEAARSSTLIYGFTSTIARPAKFPVAIPAGCRSRLHSRRPARGGCHDLVTLPFADDPGRYVHRDRRR